MKSFSIQKFELYDTTCIVIAESITDLTKIPCPLDDGKRYIALEVGSDINYSRAI